MMSDINIKIFNNWAINNKDEGMEKGHAPSVKKMISIIKERTKILDKEFNFLDLGCGNGWVVRKFSNNNLCTLAVGIDGAESMVAKAKLNDIKGQYYQENISTWENSNKFDIVFSMETFYYLDNINKVLKNIYSEKMKKNSFIVIGIDHYLENKPSLSWETDIGIKTTTLSVKEWVNQFKIAGFKDIKSMQYGSKDEWGGTLIISAKKY